jgi:hypothetical protein
LEWTEEGHEGFQYWMERFYELVEAGPLSTFLTSPDGRANKATTAAEQQGVDDVPRERRGTAVPARRSSSLRSHQGLVFVLSLLTTARGVRSRHNTHTHTLHTRHTHTHTQMWPCTP